MGTGDLLRALAADLDRHLPALRDCGVHDGRFDHEDLERLVARAPALRVTCLGTHRAEDPGTDQTDAVKQLAVYVATQDGPGLSRGEAARNLVDALEAYLPRWWPSRRMVRRPEEFAGCDRKEIREMWRELRRVGAPVLMAEPDGPLTWLVRDARRATEEERRVMVTQEAFLERVSEFHRQVLRPARPVLIGCEGELEARLLPAVVGPARELRSDNLYSGAAGRRETALWAVTWRQSIRLGESMWACDPRLLPDELYACVNGADPEPLLEATG